jgi:methylthioribulose-1-phosphate dehydratase
VTPDREIAAAQQSAPGAARLTAAGAELAAESARLAQLGWLRGSSGNLSIVLDREPLRLAVTVSGRDKGLLEAEDVVLVDRSGNSVPEQPHPELVPSAEAALHAEIAATSGAGAVVHVHALAAVQAAQRWPSGVELSDLEMLKGLGRRAEGDLVRLPVVPNSQLMSELGESFNQCYRPDTPVLLVAGHGMYVWGTDLRQARLRTECCEWLLSFALAATDRPN